MSDFSYIPQRIFQTWKVKSPLPHNFSLWSDATKKLHPEYHYDLWDDDDNRSFIADRFPWFLETYNAYPREIYRADAIRYFYLFAFGGFYMDLDVQCLSSLEKYRSAGDIILGRLGHDVDFHNSIPNAIMASKPRQTFWLFAMSYLLSDPEEGPPEHVTGPGFLKRCVDRWAMETSARESRISYMKTLLGPELRFTIDTGTISLLPPSEWYPINWTDAIHRDFNQQILDGRVLSKNEKDRIFGNSSLVAYWAHTW